MSKDKQGWSESADAALRVSAVGPIATFDPESTPGFTGDKALGEQLLGERGEVLADLQELLYANGRAGDHRSVLLVLQGMDTAGKGGAVVSDIKVSATHVDQAAKVASGDCDVYLSCDSLVGVDPANLKVASPERTTTAVSPLTSLTKQPGG